MWATRRVVQAGSAGGMSTRRASLSKGANRRPAWRWSTQSVVHGQDVGVGACQLDHALPLIKLFPALVDLALYEES